MANFLLVIVLWIINVVVLVVAIRVAINGSELTERVHNMEQELRKLRNDLKNRYNEERPG
jgi:uncharacterized membrane protein